MKLKPPKNYGIFNLINFLFFIIFLIIPIQINSAEILQINHSNSVLVGDQNRNLSINLFCTEVEDENEQIAVNLLKTNFPRGTKVKIRPYGSKDDKLIAKIYKVNHEVEMTRLLKNNFLSSDECEN